ncbi:MAG: hypothetical protein J5735_06795 [Prevotella sp.]|nr:hypothetical protein [Prevotella sp.]
MLVTQCAVRSDQRAGVTAQASDVTAPWSGDADKASDKIEADSAEIEADSIGKGGYNL